MCHPHLTAIDGGNAENAEQFSAAFGTFSRQPIERGKLHYLAFIPPTLESVRRCLDELPAMAPLAELLPMHIDVEE